MIAFLLVFLSLGRIYKQMFKQPETRALALVGNIDRCRGHFVLYESRAMDPGRRDLLLRGNPGDGGVWRYHPHDGCGQNLYDGLHHCWLVNPRRLFCYRWQAINTDRRVGKKGIMKPLYKEFEPNADAEKPE